MPFFSAALSFMREYSLPVSKSTVTTLWSISKDTSGDLVLPSQLLVPLGPGQLAVPLLQLILCHSKNQAWASYYTPLYCGLCFYSKDKFLFYCAHSLHWRFHLFIMASSWSGRSFTSSALKGMFGNECSYRSVGLLNDLGSNRSEFSHKQWMGCQPLYTNSSLLAFGRLCSSFIVLSNVPSPWVKIQ